VRRDDQLRRGQAARHEGAHGARPCQKLEYDAALVERFRHMPVRPLKAELVENYSRTLGQATRERADGGRIKRRNVSRGSIGLLPAAASHEPYFLRPLR
jgi:hypothetical protein